MLRTLNKIAGSAVGAVLYPLKALILSAVFIFATLGLALGAIVILPIFFTVVAVENSEDKFFSGLLTWLFTSFILLILVPLITLGLLVVEIYFGVEDFFKSLFLGFTDGFENGLFFHVLKRALFDFAVFNRGIAVIRTALNELSAQGSPGINDDGLAELYQDFNLSEKVNHSFEALSEVELEQARGIKELAKLVEKYESLHGRLSVLDAAMTSRTSEQDWLDDDVDNGGVEDEVVSNMPILEPALLVKKYQDTEGVWRVINTKIIDKPSMEKWLKQHNSHPVTRESMTQADPCIVDGVERQTCYKIRPYQNMNDAEELIECSLVIREAIQGNRLMNTKNARASAQLTEVIVQDNASSLPSIEQTVTGLRAYIVNTLWGEPRAYVQDSTNPAPNDQESYGYINYSSK